MERNDVEKKLGTSKFLESFETSALVETVEDILSENTSREVLLDALDDFRQGLDENSEDIVLDVMDRLVGFCTPDERL